MNTTCILCLFYYLMQMYEWFLVLSHIIKPAAEESGCQLSRVGTQWKQTGQNVINEGVH